MISSRVISSLLRPRTATSFIRNFSSQHRRLVNEDSQNVPEVTIKEAIDLNIVKPTDLPVFSVPSGFQYKS